MIQYEGYIEIDNQPIVMLFRAEHWINTIRELERIMDVDTLHPIQDTGSPHKSVYN